MSTLVEISTDAGAAMEIHVPTPDEPHLCGCGLLHSHIVAEAQEIVREMNADAASARAAAYTFLNMGRCPDCHRPWPFGYIHFACPSKGGGRG